MSPRYGPNSSEIEHFFERLQHLSLQGLGDAVRAWRDEVARSSAWHKAEDAVSRAITDTARHAAQWSMLQRLFETFRGAPWYKEHQPGSQVPGSDAAAQYVATAALLALLVRDAVPTETFEILYLPFRDIIPTDGLDASSE